MTPVTATPNRTRTKANQAASDAAEKAEKAAAKAAAKAEKDAAEQAAKDAAEDDTPKVETYAETMLAAIAEDAVSIVDAEGKKLKAADAVSVLEDLVTAATPLAAKAAIAWENAEKVGDTFADSVLGIRGRFVLVDGLPDWSATLTATKKSISPLVDAAMIPSDQGDRMRTMLRVNQAAKRRRPYFVALHVNQAEGIGLEDSEVLAAVKAGTETSKSTDAKVKKLVAKVNRQFRVGTDRPDNAARSPFEPKKDKANPTGTPTESDTERKARESLEMVQGFRTAAKVVDQGIVSHEVLEITRDAYSVLTSSKPRLGTTYKKSETADTWLKVARIAYVLAATLAGQTETLTDTETQDAVAALQRSS